MKLKIDSKKQQLLEKSTVFLASNHGASLSEIAATIGVGRATLQRYFPKRQDLLHEIALDAIHKTDDAVASLSLIEAPPKEGLLKLFEVLVPLGAHYHFLSSYPKLESEEVAQEYARQLNETTQYVQWLKEQDVIALGVPTAWVVQMIDLLVWGAWDAVERGDVARNDAAALAYRTLISGLGS